MSADDGLRLRRAEPADLDFLLELMTHEDVEPFLAVIRPRDRDGVLAEIERSQAEPEEFGRFVIEVEGQAAGLMGFEVAIAAAGSPTSAGSRCTRTSGAGGSPTRRRGSSSGICSSTSASTGSSSRSTASTSARIRHAERAGFVREGVRRKAYWRNEEWVDSVIYGLVREDLEPG